MHPDQFSENAPGTLVKVSDAEQAGWAFVPHPLPPTLTHDLSFSRALGEAREAVGELRGLGRGLADPVLLTGPLLRREAVLSSAIEGTRSTAVDLYAYEAGQAALPGIETAPEDDRHEVANYVRALYYGLERLTQLPVCLRLLREVHERLLRGVRGANKAPGQYRAGPNRIGGDGLADATFVPPPVPQMVECLDSFEKYIHAESPEDPLVRMAMLHYQFEAIHPFLDGNGRVGRLLVTLLTVYWEVLPRPLLYVSGYFRQHRAEYYDRLLQVSVQGAWDQWVRFFLQGVAETGKDTVARVERLQDLQATWRDHFEEPGRSALLPRLVDVVIRRPVLTIPQAATELGCSYHTARDHTEALAEAGLLQEIEGGRRPRVFWSKPVIQAVGYGDDAAPE